jgi:hypothetical protein
VLQYADTIITAANDGTVVYTESATAANRVADLDGIEAVSPDDAAVATEA